MSCRFALVLGIGLVGAPQMVRAAEDPVQCVDVSVPKGVVEAQHGRWIELTSDQWQFLRGVYVMNPAARPGLPYGDKAALATLDGHTGGLVFFLDGDRACTPLEVPDELLAIMGEVATATIGHQGSAL